jgi:hypothetical protein
MENGRWQCHQVLSPRSYSGSANDREESGKTTLICSLVSHVRRESIGLAQCAVGQKESLCEGVF